VDGVRIERHLAGRKDGDGLRSVPGKLRFRRIEAQRFDLVVEKIDPDRLCGTHWKYVDERTAHREFAVLRRLRHAQIAGRGQRIDECVAIEALARFERQRPGSDVVDRRQALQQHRRRGDDDAAAETGQRRKDREPLRHDVLMR
jgi:hypothetical protein